MSDAKKSRQERNAELIAMGRRALTGSGGADVRQKVQREGATSALIAASSDSDIIQTKRVALDEIVLLPGYDRDPSEYKSKEFRDFVEEIRETSGNRIPAEVRRGLGGRMELVAGYRRYHACLDAGVKKLLVNVREIRENDGTLALHETENSHRMAKSLYSRGLHYQHLIESKQVAGVVDLAKKLRLDQGMVSQAVNLVTSHPEGFWELIEDPSRVTRTQARTLLAAFKESALPSVMKALDEPVSIARLLALLRQAERKAITKPSKAKSTKAELREEKGGGFSLLLPASISKAEALRLHKILEEALSGG